jgi:hypothetical protein
LLASSAIRDLGPLPAVAVAFDPESALAAGVPNALLGFDGIACLRFLGRFHYGNFADPDAFGLDTLPLPG